MSAEAAYRLNLTHRDVAAAYSDWKQRRGIPGHVPPSDREREAFEREYIREAAAREAAAEAPEDGEKRLYSFGPISLWRTAEGFGVLDARSGEWEAREDPVEAWTIFAERMEAVGRKRMEQIKAEGF